MPTLPEKLDLETTPIREERIDQLRSLFPEAFTEGRIDFDALRRSLGDMVSTDPANERFGLRWPGKGKLQQVINQPSVGTLVPQPQESVDWDTTQNLIIEGDNLEVLKLLQKSYAGQVKMIYIDPPYNTGNDFVYPDNFTEGLQTYLEFTGQVDSGGRKLSSNTETTGRYHANWLNMMYPRLYLARNLLREDGVIFVSIDDHEVHNLRALMNEVFGEENFVADVTVVNNLKGRNDKRYIATANDRLLMFVRTQEFREEGLSLPETRLSEFSEQDDSGNNYRLLGLRKRGGADTRALRPNMFFPIFVDPESGSVSTARTTAYRVEVLPRKSDGTDGCWRWGFDTVKSRMDELEGRPVGGDGRFDVFEKDYLLSEGGTIRRIKPKSVFMGPDYSTDGATKAFRSLLPDVDFTNPKPVQLLKDLVEYSLTTTSEEVVLDFFAGSGTTAHAVMQQNAEDGGNRRYILVQLPEPLDEPKTLDDGTVLNDIADICRERVRRAARKIAAEHPTSVGANSSTGGVTEDSSSPLDTGFRAYRLAASNFRPWDGRLNGDGQPKQGELLPPANITRQLEMAADHLRPDATDAAILAELLLKIGLDLTAPVTAETMAGKRVYNVEGGTVLVCLDRHITLDAIEQMARRLPAEIICLDAGFPNDQTKVNAGQIIASAARDAEGSIEFKVV